MTPRDGSRRKEGYVTSTGWRVIGREPLPGPFVPPSAPPESPLEPGALDQTLYAVVVTVPPQSGGRSAVEAVLEAVESTLSSRGKDVAPLHRDVEQTVPPSRFGGLSFRHRMKDGEWSGRLTWRQVHPTVQGAPITTEVTLEERRRFTRLGVRVTADHGFGSVRGAVGAGHAQPEFLRRLGPGFPFTWMGAPVEPRFVEENGEEDLVRSILEDRVRSLPVAVLAPLEEGGFLIDPADLALDLMGRAHLYVFPEHQQTFRLTDAVGDKRLSCFWGALRAYMPGFTIHDDHYDHPLLVADRVTDPVMLAELLGRLGVEVGRSVPLPEVGLLEPESTVGGSMGGGRPPGHGPTASESPDRVTAKLEGKAATVEILASESGKEEGAPSAVAEATPAEGPGEEAGMRPDVAVGGMGFPVQAPPAGSVPGDLLLPVTKALEALSAQVGALQELNRRLVDEVERLRTISAVRSASTSALERRMGGLETLLTRAVEPGWESAPEVAAESATVVEGRYTLADALRSAAEAHLDTLLFLDPAFDAAAESPYEDPERVRAVLDAMARVARKRRDGELGTSLKEAFTDLGVDYRRNIAKSTPERLRQQYIYVGPEGRPIECVEHIALGQTYDPRHCLRIYFSSRAPSDTRFVIGHVGRHFEVITTN